MNIIREKSPACRAILFSILSEEESERRIGQRLHGIRVPETITAHIHRSALHLLDSEFSLVRESENEEITYFDFTNIQVKGPLPQDKRWIAVSLTFHRAQRLTHAEVRIRKLNLLIDN